MRGHFGKNKFAS